MGRPMGDPGALPGEETEERGDLLFPTFNVFSLHLLNKFTIIKKNSLLLNLISSSCLTTSTSKTH